MELLKCCLIPKKAHLKKTKTKNSFIKNSKCSKKTTKYGFLKEIKQTPWIVLLTNTSRKIVPILRIYFFVLFCSFFIAHDTHQTQYNRQVIHNEDVRDSEIHLCSRDWTSRLTVQLKQQQAEAAELFENSSHLNTYARITSIYDLSSFQLFLSYL